jgi:hypothetical protein
MLYVDEQYCQGRSQSRTLCCRAFYIALTLYEISFGTADSAHAFALLHSERADCTYFIHRQFLFRSKEGVALLLSNRARVYRSFHSIRLLLQYRLSWKLFATGKTQPLLHRDIWECLWVHPDYRYNSTFADRLYCPHQDLSRSITLAPLISEHY